MIGIINYEIGNLRSVEKALQQVGAETRWVRTPDDVEGCAGLLLPGVGAFGDCSRAFRATGLWQPVLDWIAADRPFMGICVGYQLLFEGSDESTDAAGLGVFKGRVVRFDDQRGTLKIPQIGWNTVRKLHPSSFLEGIEDGASFYFVHSYHPVPADLRSVLLRTEYGVSFAAAVARGNLLATQFHPEKSQANGLRLLGNFVARAMAPA